MQFCTLLPFAIMATAFPQNDVEHLHLYLLFNSPNNVDRLQFRTGREYLACPPSLPYVTDDKSKVHGASGANFIN